MNYKQATRIPLIVATSGVTTPGTRASNALVETVDIYPTRGGFQIRDTAEFNSALRVPAFAPGKTEALQRFERFDANKDGILSRDEFIHMGAPPKP